MSKCNGCIYHDVYRDMGSSCDVCALEKDLGSAIKRADSPDPCDWFITRDIVKNVQEFYLESTNKKKKGN